jgi:hypothetical protein
MASNSGYRVALPLCLVVGTPSCTTDGESGVSSTGSPISWGTLPAPGATTIDTPIGLALDIEDGTPVPLQIRQQQRFYVNQIDLRAHLDATVDCCVARPKAGLVANRLAVRGCSPGLFPVRPRGHGAENGGAGW